MTQSQRREFLIHYLLQERQEYTGVSLPAGEMEQRRLLRSLMNLRPPAPISGEFLRVQDEYLRERLEERGVTQLEELTPVQPGLYLWQGDITTLGVDAIVNAANSGMTGCYVPCHGCIDNAIHTFAGIQLRLECAGLMEKQGFPEPTGQGKITKAYNLPCRYVLHTVGPIVQGPLTREQERQLASCYRSCLDLAGENHCKSLAFCCISTGEFHFPNQRAAEIAVETVKAWQAQYPGELEVVFNVFKDSDREIYEKLLD
ncbi:MAG: protein-ADP-ribose hydrolase [Acutalibacter sp.]